METPSFWQKNAITVKGIVIFMLMLFLMIPTFWVSDLIREREGRQAEAVTEVSSKWGNPQTLSGPVLTIPYDIPSRNTEGKEIGRTTCFLYFLPDDLKIDGALDPEKRYRGIFEVVLYKSTISMDGFFAKPDVSSLLPDGAVLHPDKARLVLGIPDLRGLKEQVKLRWNGTEKLFDPGMPVPGLAESGMHADVPLDSDSTQLAFHIDLELKGSGSLFLTPVGKVTTVNLQSTWQDPSYTGAFLPDEKTMGPEGFKASWKVLHLNRNYPQSWTSDQQINFYDSSFGVDLLLPVDNYQKATRSVKYAILFIGLSFLALFFVEMRQSKPVHPFQYALMGLALVIFYTLLVSFSEHIHFNYAYLIAAGMTIGLAGWYAKSLFDSGKMGLLVGGTLSALYGFLFVTLQLQDYALLIGSIGLFVILAVVMYVSRRIQWHQ
ncbi:MAG: cell envelope integrity protein CreD [Lewinellaceae bacterium]|nr:cell envelope integrity protein CreD [Lewinellaceae bacterium]